MPTFSTFSPVIIFDKDHAVNIALCGSIASVIYKKVKPVRLQYITMMHNYVG